MSASGIIKRQTAASLAARKGGEKIVVLTAYTAPMAALLDAQVDVLLVGDSLGMVLYGMDSTLGVTLPMMIAHGAAVVRGSARALVVVDLPFGAYQASPEQAFNACAQVMAETGCGAVKLEGGAEMAPTIAFLVARGIPVMAHVGLRPQHVHTMGGYRVQGRDARGREQVTGDALAVQEAGAFAVVLEGVVEELAREITGKLTIPAIGIGASPACDGQVLVVDDMLGLTPRVPGFVKRYGALAGHIEDAVRAYAQEVKSGQFPGPEHCTKGKA